ncbi:MAG: hypothetical protein L3J50_05690 [Emcibacter sp.]|nr:hypothetical protein [Emcibacter sp.]
MILNTNALSTLKTALNDLIYDIGRGLDHKTLHENALSILIKLNEIEQQSKKYSQVDDTDEDKTNNEIRKVERKLKRWAKNKDQVNAKILNYFLVLQQKGNNKITQCELEKLAKKEGIKNFYGNFHGMCKISPKNHAKVFDVNNKIVSIWEPVKPFIDQYKKCIEEL